MWSIGNEIHEALDTSGMKESVSTWGWPEELKCWNWESHEGEMMQINVYTRIPFVKLELNGTNFAGYKLLTNNQ